MKDYYKILQVPNHASQEEIKKAFRSLAVKYHPDKCDLPDAMTLFQQVNEAYQTLSNPEKRAIYDFKVSQSQIYSTPAASYQQPFQPKTRYRKRYRKPIFKEDNTLELIKPYVKHAYRVSIFSLCFCGLLLVDFLLPEAMKEDVLIAKTQNYLFDVSGSRTDFLYGLNRKMPVSSEFTNMFALGGKVKIFQTPLFAVFKRVEYDRGDVLFVAMAHYNIYYTFWFLPLLLFIFSLIGVLNAEKEKLCFDMGLVSIVFLIITLVVLGVA
jgi:hypothetical protein